MSDRELARQATIIAFRNRIIGRHKIAGEAIGESKILYDGDFRYLDVVASTEVPIGAGLEEHKASWSELFRLFDEEWSLTNGESSL